MGEDGGIDVSKYFYCIVAKNHFLNLAMVRGTFI